MVDQCFLTSNFYVYLFVIGGFIFSSCLLFFGQRTYPWRLRKNRDPDNCGVVDAEIVSQKETQEQHAKWKTIVKKERRRFRIARGPRGDGNDSDGRIYDGQDAG